MSAPSKSYPGTSKRWPGVFCVLGYLPINGRNDMHNHKKCLNGKRECPEPDIGQAIEEAKSWGYFLHPGPGWQMTPVDRNLRSHQFATFDKAAESLGIFKD